MREFLKGGKYLGDAAWAQDETGYNYREMYQMATTHGDAPANTNLELVLDASSLHLLGTSEAGTGKTLDFAKKRQRIHQLVPSAARGRRNYLQFYCSYGIQYNGKVHVYTLDDLNTTAGQDALINLCDKYYPTLASSWAAYGKSLADVADAAALREAKLAYIPNTLQRGSMVYYEVIPESIVITAPFLMNMTPTMSNASRFTQQQEGTPKYAYTLCLSESFPWTSWWPIRLPKSARKRAKPP